MNEHDWSNSCVRAAYVADTMNAACRTTMEDECIVEDCFVEKSDAFFAVLDGHGGRGIVEFVEKNLAENFKRELAFDPKRTMNDRLTSAYLVTDVMSRKAGLMSSGCTAVTAFVTKNQNTGKSHLFCANVGDARVVVAKKDGTAVRMTYDHKASDASEKKRIIEAGGFVMRNRVLAMLAVSRSFGDHGLKQFVSCRPYLKDIPVEGHDFMVLACDGVFDVMDDQEVVDFVQTYKGNGMREREVAKALVDKALEKQSTDNITVCVVFFRE
eukprot:g577.t1